jgi:hypothetical protein
MTLICMCRGEDIGTVPAEAVCFKRVHTQDFNNFNNSTLYCLNNT